MTKEEIRNYAISLLEPEIAKIEDAYNKGFEDGKKSVPASTPSVIELDGVKFYDLGLPSGTLISEQLRDESGEQISLPYDAVSYYNLLTEELIEEINNCCIIRNKVIIGSNGTEYDFYNGSYTWVYNSPDTAFKSYFAIDINGDELRYSTHFKGEKYNVIITKKK